MELNASVYKTADTRHTETVQSTLDEVLTSVGAILIDPSPEGIARLGDIPARGIDEASACGINLLDLAAVVCNSAYLTEAGEVAQVKDTRTGLSRREGNIRLMQIHLHGSISESKEGSDLGRLFTVGAEIAADDRLASTDTSFARTDGGRSASATVNTAATIARPSSEATCIWHMERGVVTYMEPKKNFREQSCSEVPKG